MKGGLHVYRRADNTGTWHRGTTDFYRSRDFWKKRLMQKIVLLEKKNQFTIKDELVDTIIHDISGNVLFSCNGTKTFLQDRPGPSSPQTQGRPEEFFEAPRKAPDRSLNTALSSSSPSCFGLHSLPKRMEFKYFRSSQSDLESICASFAARSGI